MPDAPAVIQTLCPGCGRPDTAFPCPTCGTPAPHTLTPQPPERSASAVLFLGGTLVVTGLLFLMLVPPPIGLVGGGVLGFIGLAMVVLSAWNLRDPPQPWLVEAEGAQAQATVHRGALQFSLGTRTREAPVAPRDHDVLGCTTPGELRTTLQATVPDPERRARIDAALQLLGKVARHEAAAVQVTTTPWADGQDQPAKVTFEARPVDEAATAPGEAVGDELTGEVALQRWRADHAELWSQLVQ